MTGLLTARLPWALGFFASLGMVLCDCQKDQGRVHALEESQLARGGGAAPSGQVTAPPAVVGVIGGPWGLAVSDAEPAGARVVAVDPDSRLVGLVRPGDVVRFIGDAAVEDAAGLGRLLRAGPKGEIDVERDGQALGLPIPQAPPPASRGESAASAAGAPAPTAPTAPTAGASPATDARPPVSIIVIQPVPGGAPTPAPYPVLEGGGAPLTSERPPAFSAPGIAQTPGATFAPAAGTEMEAAPQIPGVSLPPGARAVLGSGSGPTGLGMGVPGGPAAKPATPSSQVRANPQTRAVGPVVPPRAAPRGGGVR